MTQWYVMWNLFGGVDELVVFVFTEVKAALVADLGDEGADVFVSKGFEQNINLWPRHNSEEIKFLVLDKRFVLNRYFYC